MSRSTLDAAYEKSLDCVHCGLCLPACPTYRETGRETSSPRGRIYLVRGVAEGRIPLAETVNDELFLCLGCRACETACPSGVQFGSILEDARAVASQTVRPNLVRRVERFALRQVVPHPKRLSFLMTVLRAVQQLGLDRLFLGLLPARMREAHALLPAVPERALRQPLPERIAAEGTQRGRVALFTGCVMPELFGAVNAATARLLSKNGFEVLIPRTQGCCGALHAHSGDAEFARELLDANLRCFDSLDVDAIVVNSAGCGAAMLEADGWRPGRGQKFAQLVRDVCQFLDEQGLRPPRGRSALRVCYDDPCHLVHGQGVADAPRRLLAQIPGLELVSHDDPGSCCGAAGTYNLTQPAMANAVRSRKLDSLAAADPDAIATGNPGCLMQLRAGAAERGLRAKVLHPVELLDAAYL